MYMKEKACEMYQKENNMKIHQSTKSPCYVHVHTELLS